MNQVTDLLKPRFEHNEDGTIKWVYLHWTAVECPGWKEWFRFDPPQLLEAYVEQHKQGFLPVPEERNEPKTKERDQGID